MMGKEYIGRIRGICPSGSAWRRTPCTQTLTGSDHFGGGDGDGREKEEEDQEKEKNRIFNYIIAPSHPSIHPSRYKIPITKTLT